MTLGESGFDPQDVERFIGHAIPHVGALGVDVVAFEKNSATLKLAYHERFVGNPETGTLHGGVITTLIDTVCGMCVFAALPEIMRIATLDLRIDYLRPATPGRELLARGDCYRLTRNVAFARGVAYHDDPEEPIANALATFIINTPDGPSGGKGKGGIINTPDGSTGVKGKAGR